MESIQPVTVTVPRELFRRRWMCRVVGSGFHNGAWCTDEDPHGDPWNCRYIYECILTEDQFLRLSTHYPAPKEKTS